MVNLNKNRLICLKSTLKDALYRLNQLKYNLVLFVINDDEQLVGSITDGDIRRSLLRGNQLKDNIAVCLNHDCHFLTDGSYSYKEIQAIREKASLKLLPVVDNFKRVLRFVNLSEVRSILPLQAIIMAGGEGLRLRPLTESVPKPLLKVGEQPILERNIDRLSSFGITDYTLSVNYLGKKIEAFFGSGKDKGISIKYIYEKEKLGTIGSVGLINSFSNEDVLVMNSDLLTNLDYEDFYKEFKKSNAALAVATIPYKVPVPYAVFEAKESRVLSLKEKPTYTYFSNAGIYLIKTKFLELIPSGVRFDATDLIELMIKNGEFVFSYPIRGYWLDIGKHEDFKKANNDLAHINFS
jgi:dTDP-glucose pyrophosphorylase